MVLLILFESLKLERRFSAELSLIFAVEGQLDMGKSAKCEGLRPRVFRTLGVFESLIYVVAAVSSVAVFLNEPFKTFASSKSFSFSGPLTFLPLVVTTW